VVHIRKGGCGKRKRLQSKKLNERDNLVNEGLELKILLRHRV
jgi:hypothetical protein